MTIWVARVGDDLYVRSYRGRGGACFHAAEGSHEDRIRAGGVEKDVTFVAESDSGLNDQIDATYLSKYGQSPYISGMVASKVRLTTLKLGPQTSA